MYSGLVSSVRAEDGRVVTYHDPFEKLEVTDDVCLYEHPVQSVNHPEHEALHSNRCET